MNFRICDEIEEKITPMTPNDPPTTFEAGFEIA
jgi:hypothetical protein